MTLQAAADAVLREFIQKDGGRIICLHCFRSAPAECPTEHAEDCVIAVLAEALNPAPPQPTPESIIQDLESRN